ncbi:MAG TPA: FecR domain-containing protein [Gemmatimonadaceae bacterium]|nr:FecR domain-containing protein [Gemmatimonadaceae bacterium]
MTADNHPPDDTQSPDWEVFVRQLDSMRLSAPSDVETEAALRKVKANPAFSRRRTRWIPPMPAVAAAALLAVGLASWMAYRNRSPVPAVASIHGMFGTGVGARDSLTLSDGTRVIIGPLSSITVPADYGTTSRSVEVKGDAWFDVVHDAGKPFTVHAGNAAIVDVGTKFTVRSDDPAGVSVSVSQGSVSLRQMNTPVQQGVILKAGDNGVLRNGGQVVTRRGAVTDDDVAWLKGRLVFREAPISEIVSSMRKWYGIELEVPDRTLASRHITASFAGESPERVLEVIRLALGAEMERHGDTAVVRSAKGNMR